MKKPFQVGDRVAIYSDSRRETGTVYHEDKPDGVTVCVRLDYECAGPLGSSFIHPNIMQCRRLVPKKRREIWVNEFRCDDNDSYIEIGRYRTEQEARENVLTTELYLGPVRFVEAKEKKK